MQFAVVSKGILHTFECMRVTKDGTNPCNILFICITAIVRWTLSLSQLNVTMYGTSESQQFHAE